MIPAHPDLLSLFDKNVTGASLVPSAINDPLTVISVRKDMNSGSVLVPSDAVTRITVPGEMVSVTPFGTRMFSSTDTSPDQVVSDSMVFAKAGEGRKRTKKRR